MKVELDMLPNVYLVSINSKDFVNFKTALNHIVKNLTEKNSKGEPTVNEDDDDLRYDKRLRYDLDIVAEWCRRLVKNDPSLNDLGDLRVVISFDDADSFDVTILTSIIKMLHSYISHIPVKIILSVATSIEVFEEKLPRSLIRQLSGQSINAQLNDGFITILKSTIFQQFELKSILLGPNLFTSMIQRQKQSLESIDAYVSSLKYAYMSHYYSNPFAGVHRYFDPWTRVVNWNGLAHFLTPRHCAALRQLPSFRDYAERSLSSLGPKHLESLFTQDEPIIQLVGTSIQEFYLYKQHMLYGLNLLMVMQNALKEFGEDGKIADTSIVDLYPSILSGEITSMKIFNDLKESVSSASPNVLAVIIFEFANFADPEKFSELADRILDGEFRAEVDLFVDISGPEYIVIENCLDSREKLKRYAKLQKIITNLIFQELTESFCSYRTFFFHEAFVVDTVNLQENVFMPTHRGAIEMGLSNPKHYWGNVLTDSMTNRPATEDGLNLNGMSDMGSDPHLCIMYTLYRESSLFINIYDWYTTFASFLKKPEKEDPLWEKKVLSWFLQGVAELKFLGIVRDSKRKFECVEKLVWRGL